MPTYDYRCPNGHDFEHFFRKISDAQAEFACPVCGAVGQRRMSKGAGLVFKGSGFYLTDYGRNAHRTSGPDSSGGGDSKSESAAEPKSASTAESTSPSKSDGAKADSGASKSESASVAKSEPATAAKATKKNESKPSSGKTKGGTSE